MRQLCAVRAPSGNEGPMRDFLLEYVQANMQNWKVQPQLVYGDDFQDCLILVFGKPRTAIFAHTDSIGFTVRYDNKLVQIGGPVLKTGTKLVGSDSAGEIESTVLFDEEIGLLCLDSLRQIERGTEMTFKPVWREDDEFVQCCYLDNRLGVYSALKTAETITDGAIVFSCWEEHGGGSVSYLIKYLYEQYRIRQALISDITWVTEGVHPGHGVVISMRDRSLPRRSFVNKIIGHGKESGIPYQLEVEEHGGSDGKEIQASPYPIDWIFIGAAEDHVHSPDEKVHKKDIDSMVDFYNYLMEKL
ncbi:MAG: M20/M25/M40 family metallo-hydrolase [Bacteroidota bacterium]